MTLTLWILVAWGVCGLLALIWLLRYPTWRD